jgi:polyhydroxyalkanoate synthesis regulator phasin
MADSNLLRRFLDAGVAFTQLTQARAEAIVKDLVNAGDVQTSQAQAAVAELIERSRENTERLLDQVRTDVRVQLGNMGLATREDIARLEGQISALGASVRQQVVNATAPSPAPTPPQTSTRPTSTTPAKKRTPAKRTPATTAAKQATAKQSTAKRSTAKRSPAKAAAKKR